MHTASRPCLVIVCRPSAAPRNRCRVVNICTLSFASPSCLYITYHALRPICLVQGYQLDHLIAKRAGAPDGIRRVVAQVQLWETHEDLWRLVQEAACI